MGQITLPAVLVSIKHQQETRRQNQAYFQTHIVHHRVVVIHMVAALIISINFIY